MTAPKWKPGVPLTWKDLEDYQETDMIYYITYHRAFQVGFLKSASYKDVRNMLDRKLIYTAVKLTKENVCQKKQQ